MTEHGVATVDNRTEPGLIRAAGGLLWRPAGAGYELAVIYRQRYADWTLPKGKLHAGESWQEAALREVGEETGYWASITGFAGAVAYTTERGPKVVRFWHMTVTGETGLPVDPEVSSVHWLTHADACRRLQYPLERALLEAWRGPQEAAS
jgi:ADP-ribose pyrophosphatase YjhB (NUDIX family)